MKRLRRLKTVRRKCRRRSVQGSFSRATWVVCRDRKSRGPRTESSWRPVDRAIQNTGAGRCNWRRRPSTTADCTSVWRVTTPGQRVEKLSSLYRVLIQLTPHTRCVRNDVQFTPDSHSSQETRCAYSTTLLSRERCRISTPRCRISTPRFHGRVSSQATKETTLVLFCCFALFAFWGLRV